MRSTRQKKILVLIGIFILLVQCPAFLQTSVFDALRLIAHAASVKGAAFSPKTAFAATVGDDQTARLWNIPSGILEKTFSHFDDVNAVAFSPDGTKLLTGSSDNFARIWDIQTNRTLFTFGHFGDVLSVAYSPDGKYIATASEDNEARLWNAGTGELIVRFQHEDNVNAIAISPDSRRLVTGVSDSSAYLWDISSITIPTPIVTPTVTPTPSPTPTPALAPPSPRLVFSFNSNVEFGRVPGGFGGADSGSSVIGAIPQSARGLSDGFGAIITTTPGQVELLTFPVVDVNDGILVMRASVQATGHGTAISLAAADNSLDGSLILNTQTESGRYLNEYRQIVSIYNPDDTKVIPIFQAANTRGDGSITVYLDQLEIYVLPKSGVIPNEFLFGIN